MSVKCRSESSLSQFSIKAQNHHTDDPSPSPAAVSLKWPIGAEVGVVLTNKGKPIGAAPGIVTKHLPDGTYAVVFQDSEIAKRCRLVGRVIPNINGNDIITKPDV